MQTFDKIKFIFGPKDGKKTSRAQSVFEYALLISIVAIALMTMSVYVRKALDTNIKTIEEKINPDVETGSKDDARIILR